MGQFWDNVGPRIRSRYICTEEVVGTWDLGLGTWDSNWLNEVRFGIWWGVVQNKMRKMRTRKL